MASTTMSLAVKLQAIDNISTPLRGIVGATTPVITSLQQTQHQVTELASRIQTAEQQNPEATSKLAALASGAQKTGQVLNQALAGPLQTAIQFEHSMTQLGTLIAGSTSDDIAQLTAKAEQMGLTTSFSVTKSAMAMNTLAQAGFNTNQILAAMPSLANLTQASGMGQALGDVSSMATELLTSLDMAPQQLGQLADVLAATSHAGGLSLTQLKDSMTSLAPVARGAGMDLQQTAAMAGLLSDVGISGEQAGATLTSLLANLSAPSGAAADALQQLGVKTRNANGNMRGMVDILGDVANAATSMAPPQQLQTLVDIIGEKPANGLQSVLAQEGVAGVTKYLDALRSTKGVAAALAQETTDDTATALQTLKAAGESLKTSLAGALLPTIKEAIFWVNGIVQRFSAWARAHPAVTQGLVLSAGAIYGLVMVTGSLLSAWERMTQLSELTRKGITKLGETSLMTSARMGLVTAAQWAMNAAFLANPLTWIIAAVVALSAILGVLIYKYFQPLKAFLSGFWDGFLQGFAPIIQLCSGLFAALSPIGDVLAWVWQGVKGVFDWFSQLFQPVNASTEVLQAATGAGMSLGQYVGEALNILLVPVKLVIAGFSLLGDFIHWVAEVAAAAWQGITEGATSLWDVLKSVFEWSPFGLLKKGWDVAFTWIKDKLNWLGSAVSKVKSFFGVGDEDEQPSAKKDKNLDQLVAEQKQRQQQENVARLEVVKTTIPEPQTATVSRLHLPKATVAAGMLAAGTMEMPAAAKQVPLPPTYQETLVAHQAPAPTAVPSASLSKPTWASSSLPSGANTISIAQLDIHVASAQGMDTQQLAEEVRKQFMQLMHEQQAKHRGELYDS